MSRIGYSSFKILGEEGNKVNIIPTSETQKYCKNITEIYNKKGEYLGIIVFDTRKKWNQYTLVELDDKMQMTKDCIDEAFKLTKEYWTKN